jgi:hypothetical protein
MPIYSLSLSLFLFFHWLPDEEWIELLTLLRNDIILTLNPLSKIQLMAWWEECLDDSYMYAALSLLSQAC